MECLIHLILLILCSISSFGNEKELLFLEKNSNYKVIFKSDFGQKKNVGDLGVESFLEIYNAMNNPIKLGVGFGYKHNPKSQLGKAGLDDSFRMYDSIPIYVFSKVDLMSSSKVNLYIKNNLGYTFNIGNGSFFYDDSSGEVYKVSRLNYAFYYSVGAGVEVDNFIIDFSYNVNDGKLNIIGVNSNLKKPTKAVYKNIVLLFGYKFDI